MSRISKNLAESPHNHSFVNGFATNMHSIGKISTMVPKIAVVGAGMAGLRCADVLLRAGFNVTVFEARNRIGGRVHQMLSGGHLVDMGANWIHGTTGNPIMKLAEQTRSVVMNPEQDGATFDSHGSRLLDDLSDELGSTIWGLVAEAFKYSDENTPNIDKDASLMDFFRDRLSKTVIDEKKRELLLQEALMWGPFVGDPVDRQSLKFFFMEECIEGDTVFVASTYQEILKAVGRPVLEKTDIRFDTEVVNVARNDTPELTCHNLTLTTRSGDTYTFDEVVITCPLGWLKRNKTTAFSPPLPLRLSQAIDSINYGRLEKLYITFPSAFWLTSSTTYPTFTHFHNPEYVSHPQSPTWNQDMMSLAHLPDSQSHPTLLFYIYGPCATWVVQSVTDVEPQSDRYNTILDAFARPFYSRLPNFSPSNPNCKPTAFLMTQWQNDPFAGNGSYSNFQVGLERGDEDVEVMTRAGGLNEHGLWLAGEHTAPFIALGTTTGAYWSGEGVARRICHKYDMEVTPEEGMGIPEMNVTVDQSTQATLKKDVVSREGDVANLNGFAV